MDAVFLLLMGAGGFLMWSAYKNEAPWTTALSVLSATSTPAKG